MSFWAVAVAFVSGSDAAGLGGGGSRMGGAIALGAALIAPTLAVVAVAAATVAAFVGAHTVTLLALASGPALIVLAVGLADETTAPAGPDPAPNCGPPVGHPAVTSQFPAPPTKAPQL